MGVRFTRRRLLVASIVAVFVGLVAVAAINDSKPKPPNLDARSPLAIYVDIGPRGASSLGVFSLASSASSQVAMARSVAVALKQDVGKCRNRADA